MQKILKYSLPVFIMLFVVSCDKGLDRLNESRTNPTTLDPALILNNAIINTSYPARTLVFEVSIVQQMVTPNGGVLAGANFNQDSRDVTLAGVWAVYYQAVIKNTHDVIVRTKEDAARTNLYNMARIWQAYTFMVLTDSYGEIPYFQGGAGFSQQIFLPEYDTQQDI